MLTHVHVLPRKVRVAHPWNTAGQANHKWLDEEEAEEHGEQIRPSEMSLELRAALTMHVIFGGYLAGPNQHKVEKACQHRPVNDPAHREHHRMMHIEIPQGTGKILSLDYQLCV